PGRKVTSANWRRAQPDAGANRHRLVAHARLQPAEHERCVRPIAGVREAPAKPVTDRDPIAKPEGVPEPVPKAVRPTPERIAAERIVESDPEVIGIIPSVPIAVGR